MEGKDVEIGVKNKKERIKDWLKKKDNLIFLAIFIFSIIIRLYYFNITKSQPLWWDEADYMAYAKNLAGFNIDWVITAQHNSLLPHLVSLFFSFGFSEATARFLVGVLPSILVVFFTYLTVGLMYQDRRIALISAFLMATLWEILFNTFRFHLENTAFFFGLLSIYVFWEGYEKKEKIFGKIDPKWAMSLTAVLIFLTYGFRRGYFLFGIFFFFYLVTTKRIKDIVRDRYNWLALFIFITLFFLAEKYIFTVVITEASQQYFHFKDPIRFVDLQIFGSYFRNIAGSFSPLLYLFYLGLISTGLNVLIFLGHLRKNENKKARADLFLMLTLVVTFGYFIIIQRNQTVGEPRWYFPVLLAAFVSISRGTLLITDYVKKYNRQVATAIILLLIGYGGYYELQHADMIIKNKATSFEGIKQAGFFLEETSSPNDLIVSVPKPQLAYYSNRVIISPMVNLEINPERLVTFEQFLSELEKDETNRIKYLVISFSEPNHPEWMRRDEYTQHQQTGQIALAKWIIPFMDTEIDFITGKQDIKQTKKYGNITFTLRDIKQEVFIYEITRARETEE